MMPLLLRHQYGVCCIVHRPKLNFWTVFSGFLHTSQCEHTFHTYAIKILSIFGAHLLISVECVASISGEGAALGQPSSFYRHVWTSTASGCNNCVLHVSKDGILPEP